MAGIFNRAIFNDAIFNTAPVRQAAGKASKSRRRRRVIVDGKLYDVRTEYELETLLTALIQKRPVPQKIAQRPIKKDAPVEVIKLPALKEFDWTVMESKPLIIDPAIATMLAHIRARMEDERDVELLLLGA